MGEISITSRAKIFSEFLGQKSSVSEKHVYAMCGIPGSGKSTYVSNSLAAGIFPEDAFILNPDYVMNALPEYRAAYEKEGAEAAFKKWEMPTRELAYDMLQQAAEKELNIIIDMGCVREEDFNNILGLKKHGYQIHMHHIYCPPEIAIKRIQTRERYTPESMIWDRYEALKQMVSKYQVMAHQFLLFDNSDEEQPFRQMQDGGFAKAV